MTVDVSESVEPSPVVESRSRPWRSLIVAIAVVVVLVVALAADWAYSYNPLAQNFQQAKGEFGSYVGTTRGVEAHFTDTSPQGSLMATVVWNEPTGKFVVQFETEIDNTGGRSVRIDGVGTPSFGYHTSGYRVSFYHNAPFPNEAGAPFHSFTLAAHSERIVTVSYSQYCTTKAPVTEDGRALPSGPTSLPVTYSFLGFSHTDEVPIAPFTFVAPVSC
jgi:hypothetical protein